MGIWPNRFRPPRVLLRDTPDLLSAAGMSRDPGGDAARPVVTIHEALTERPNDMRTIGSPRTDADEAIFDDLRFPAPRTARPRDPAGERYSTGEVAALSTEAILAMSRPELIEVIRSVRGGHLRPGVRERLPQMDRETLRRLVFLTRRLCRNRQLLETHDAPAGLVAAYCA
jgi:hypothetical protein